MSLEPLGKCKLCNNQAAYTCYYELPPNTTGTVRISGNSCVKMPKGCGDIYCQSHIKQVRLESRDSNGHIMGTAFACMMCEKCRLAMYKKVGSMIRCCSFATILMPFVIVALVLLITFASVGMFSSNEEY